MSCYLGEGSPPNVHPSLRSLFFLRAMSYPVMHPRAPKRITRSGRLFRCSSPDRESWLSPKVLRRVTTWSLTPSCMSGVKDPVIISLLSCRPSSCLAILPSCGLVICFRFTGVRVCIVVGVYGCRTLFPRWRLRFIPVRRRLGPVSLGRNRTPLDV